MKKFVGCLLAITVAAVSLATGVTASTGATNQSTITLTLAANTNTKIGFDAVIANFKRAYPRIDVRATYYDATAYQTILPTQFAGGNAADIVLTPATAGPHSVLVLARAGRLANLSGRPWQGRIVKSASVRLNNRVYAWPLGTTLFTLAVNLDMFREMGLTRPRTFTQLLNLCTRVRNQGVIPITFGLASANDIAPLTLQVVANAVQSRNLNWTSLRQQNRVTFSGTPGYTRAMEMAVSLHRNCMQPGATGTTRNQSYALFTSGRALMVGVPSTSIGGLLQPAAPRMRIGAMPIPGDADKFTRGVEAAPNAIAVNAASRNLAAARQFVDFIAREGQANLLARVNTLISPTEVKRNTLPAMYKQYYGPLYAKNKNGVDKMVTGVTTGWPSSVLAASQTLGQGLFTGQVSIPEYLSGLDSAWARATD